MPDLTLQQRFGTNASFDETTKVLSISLSDLTDSGDIANNLGLDISNITSANINTYSTKILWTLLLLSFQKQPETNNDETVGVYVTNQGKRSITRNSVSQFGYQLVATAYKNDTLGNVLDPDGISS